MKSPLNKLTCLFKGHKPGSMLTETELCIYTRGCLRCKIAFGLPVTLKLIEGPPWEHDKKEWAKQNEIRLNKVRQPVKPETIKYNTMKHTGRYCPVECEFDIDHKIDEVVKLTKDHIAALIEEVGQEDYNKIAKVIICEYLESMQPVKPETKQ